jgi:hypothetical protein
MRQHDCDKSQIIFEIHAERSQNCHRICKTLSQQKQLVLQPTAPLQLKYFKFGSKMAIASFAPVLPNQEKNSVTKSPDSLIHPVLHFLHDRSNWSSPSLSSTTFQNFPGIYYLLFEVFQFHRRTELYFKCSNLLVSFLILSAICWWKEPIRKNNIVNRI